MRREVGSNALARRSPTPPARRVKLLPRVGGKDASPSRQNVHVGTSAVEDRKQHARFSSPAAQRHHYDPNDPVAAPAVVGGLASGGKGDENSQRGGWKTKKKERQKKWSLGQKRW